MPGMEKYLWHSDFPYHKLDPPWPSGNFTGQTIWMLDDFTVENGATAIAPCSHRKLHPPPEKEKWRDDAEIVTGVRGSVLVAHGAYWIRLDQTRPPIHVPVFWACTFRPCFIPQEDMLGQLAELKNPSETVR
jgi:hypothetical protein